MKVVKNGLAAGGWIVALAAVAVVVAVKSRKPDGEAPQVPKPARAPVAAEAASAKEKAPVLDVVIAAGTEAEEEPGADWSLPADCPDTPQALYASLGNVPADVKAVADAIMGDLSKGGSEESLAIVRKAAKLKNEKVQMMALMLLGRSIHGVRTGDNGNPDMASEMTAAAHDFCASGNEMIAGASFEMFCLAASLDHDDAARRDYMKSVLCDWKKDVAMADDAAFRCITPDGSSQACDIGEWARMLSDVIERAPNEASVATAKAVYSGLTQTDYTTREDADAWVTRHENEERRAKAK